MNQFAMVFLSIIHVLISIFLIISILLQASRGGGLAGMFGGGGGMTGMFGGRGAASFLAKVTMWLAIGFALTSLSIFAISTRQESRSALREVQGSQSPLTDEIPAIPESAPEPLQNPAGTE
jgi:preprotein translocase subunit SecG